MAKLGFEGVVQFKVGGISGGGSWTTATQVRNVTITNDKMTADATTRGFNNKRFVTGLKDRGVSMDMVYEPGDAGFEAFRDAYEADTHADSIIGVRFLDGDTDAEGLSGDWIVTKFSEPQQLEDVMGVEIELKPAHSDEAGDVQRVDSITL